MFGFGAPSGGGGGGGGDISVVKLGRTITDAEAPLIAADVGRMVFCERATDQTITIPVGLLKPGKTLTLMQLGAGIVQLAVANSTAQVINSARYTYGQDSVVQLLRIADSLTDQEVYKVIGGIGQVA
jgi:hypothetical protein